MISCNKTDMFYQDVGKVIVFKIKKLKNW